MGWQSPFLSTLKYCLPTSSSVRLFTFVLDELTKSIPVHSLILSSHLFFYPPFFLCPFTVSCRVVFAKLCFCLTLKACVQFSNSAVTSIQDYRLVGWLVLDLRPFETVFQSISCRLPERGRNRRERIEDSC